MISIRSTGKANCPWSISINLSFKSIVNGLYTIEKEIVICCSRVSIIFPNIFRQIINLCWISATRCIITIICCYGLILPNRVFKSGFFRNYPYYPFDNISFAANNSLLQRPYMVRFIIFNLLFVPSTKPFDKGLATAFSTAAKAIPHNAKQVKI